MSQNTIPIRPNPQNPQGGSAKLLWIALALGVVAVIANLAYIQIIKEQSRQSVFSVYQFNRPIKAGRTIRKADLKVLAMPDTAQKGFDAIGVVSQKDLINYLGREALNENVTQGQLLTYSLFLSNTGNRIDDQIAKNMRWVSLPINSRTVPGALRVGMYVDIEAPFNTGGAYPQILPVMERVQIQALGTTTISNSESSDRPGRNFQTITIQVTPNEATELAMIQRIAAGDFDLQPRNPDDTKLVKIPEGGINPAVLNLMAKITQENPADLKNTSKRR